MAVIIGPFEFVAGDTGVDFYPTITDYQNNPINISGAQQLKVYGRSLDDLPGVDINITTGTVFDGPSGVAKFAQFGNAITPANLGALPHATYKLRVMLTDSGGKILHTPEFLVTFVHRPI